jgi:hypothetical protein
VNEFEEKSVKWSVHILKHGEPYRVTIMFWHLNERQRLESSTIKFKASEALSQAWCTHPAMEPGAGLESWDQALLQG